MDRALIICRAVQFISAMVVFGGAAFPLYAMTNGDPQSIAAFAERLRKLLLISASVAFLSALALVPIIGGTMAGSALAALDWKTISAVLWQTSFGRIWRWHLVVTALLVAACAIRRVRPCYRMGLAALLLASLGWIGHATIGAGRIGIAHQVNQSIHLLASGIWLGGLVPLAALVIRAKRSGDGKWFALMRTALPRFSGMGYAAIALVAITGIVNTIILVGSGDGLVRTPYGRLLLVKIGLFLLLGVFAGVNRFVLVPRISRERAPLTGTAALMWTIIIEQVLGLAILAVVSVLGTWPPALYIHR
jgi:putative copper resistance protein D